MVTVFFYKNCALPEDHSFILPYNKVSSYLANLPEKAFVNLPNFIPDYAGFELTLSGSGFTEYHLWNYATFIMDGLEWFCWCSFDKKTSGAYSVTMRPDLWNIFIKSENYLDYSSFLLTRGHDISPYFGAHYSQPKIGKFSTATLTNLNTDVVFCGIFSARNDSGVKLYSFLYTPTLNQITGINISDGAGLILEWLGYCYSSTEIITTSDATLLSDVSIKKMYIAPTSFISNSVKLENNSVFCYFKDTSTPTAHTIPISILIYGADPGGTKAFSTGTFPINNDSLLHVGNNTQYFEIDGGSGSGSMQYWYSAKCGAYDNEWKFPVFCNGEYKDFSESFSMPYITSPDYNTTQDKISDAISIAGSGVSLLGSALTGNPVGIAASGLSLASGVANMATRTRSRYASTGNALLNLNTNTTQGNKVIAMFAGLNLQLENNEEIAAEEMRYGRLGTRILLNSTIPATGAANKYFQGELIPKNAGRFSEFIKQIFSNGVKICYNGNLQ